MYIFMQIVVLLLLLHDITYTMCWCFYSAELNQSPVSDKSQVVMIQAKCICNNKKQQFVYSRGSFRY